MHATKIVSGLISFFLGLAEIFLGLRVLLRFFAANPDNGFAQWVYNSSDILLQPFRGIFPTEVIGNNHVVDFSALFAMVIYGLLAVLLAWLVEFTTPQRRSSKK